MGKLLDKIRAHPAVDVCLEEKEAGGMTYFTYLKPGWEWSEQKGFGCETLRETWALVKEAKRVERDSDAH